MTPSPVRSAVGALALLAAALIFAAPAMAQAPGKPPTSEFADRCPGLVAGVPSAPASLLRAALAYDQARIVYVGHSTFLIESPKLVRIATDYNDYVRPPLVPDIVTMNRAHSTHYSELPDPGIKHVLRGWKDDGAPSAHDLTFQDVRVRSIATNIRDVAGGTAIRSSYSRSPISASPIWAICIIFSRKSS